VTVGVGAGVGAASMVWRGRVEEFDEAVGLGQVRSGSDSFGFHCTQIAGGLRTIEVGTAVVFTVVAGRGGRWEAVGVGPA
jgi:cold shock CspA family protein